MSSSDPIKNIINYNIKYLPLALKVQLIDRNVLKGQNGYTKFIILGNPRTGSNLLMTSLKSHKNVISYGEIFNEIVRDWDIPILYRNCSDFNLLKEKPVEFVSSRIFRKYPDSVKAVGFKIFYSQTPFHKEHRDSVWQYLKENDKINIIHLKRRNILKSHLSRIIAIKTKKFVNIMNTNAANVKVSLDYDECLKVFEYTRKMENEYDSLFKGHKKINVFYENLHHKFSEEMEKVQIFLGLNPCPLKPQIFKQARYELHEAIINFNELKNKFSSTEWSCFFEE